LFVSFFFQAEDGIRDLYVTGVQTCALPILDGDYGYSAFYESIDVIIMGRKTYLLAEKMGANPYPGKTTFVLSRTRAGEQTEHVRSEERRVGKECRSRWWAYH